MSNLWLNLRVWYLHFQIMRDRPWVRIGMNWYLWDHPQQRIGFFRLHEAPWRRP